MPSESDFRDELRGSSEVPTRGIDTASVLRRVRARRVPRQVAFSSLALLAVAGVATLGVWTLPGMLGSQTGAMNSAVSAPQPASGAGDSKGGTAGASEAPSGTGQFANACGAPVVAEAPHATGLRLTLEFPDSAPATGTAIEGTVLLTNTSSTHVSGMTAVMPFMTLSRDGVIAWHSNGAMDSAGVVVDLAPGASMPYSVSVVPVQCGPEDELGPAFRAGLPPIAAGKLQLNAEIVFLPDSSGAEGEILVTGPPETIDLR